MPDENGIIEQFDGYFKHEDVYVPTVRARLVKPNEYWGGSTGVATATRVIKQADVVSLLCTLPERFSDDVARKNYDFICRIPSTVRVCRRLCTHFALAE